MKNINLFPSIKLFDLVLDEPNSVFAPFYSNYKIKTLTNKDYTNYNSPTYESKDEFGNYCLELELPGIKKEDIKVSVENNLLEIKAERKDRNIVIERKYTLSKNVDHDKISSKLEDGVLKIILPSKNQEKEKPKLIKVE